MNLTICLGWIFQARKPITLFHIFLSDTANQKDEILEIPLLTAFLVNIVQIISSHNFKL